MRGVLWMRLAIVGRPDTEKSQLDLNLNKFYILEMSDFRRERAELRNVLFVAPLPRRARCAEHHRLVSIIAN